MLVITSLARQHINFLLKKYSKETGICVFLKNFKFSSSSVECGIRFCLSSEFCSSDFVFEFDFFCVYIYKDHMPFLRDVEIDILQDNLETQLTIRVKNVKSVQFDCVAVKEELMDIPDLEVRVRDFLNSNINPQLALHGGSVSLVEITRDFLVVIQFFGGCNGCSMAAYTIKEGIENVLVKSFPVLKGIIDVTSHNRGEHSYF